MPTRVGPTKARDVLAGWERRRGSVRVPYEHLAGAACETQVAPASKVGAQRHSAVTHASLLTRLSHQPTCRDALRAHTLSHKHSYALSCTPSWRSSASESVPPRSPLRQRGTRTTARGGAGRRPRRDAIPRPPDAAAPQRAVLGGRLDRSDVPERRAAREIAICVAWRWVRASLALLALGGPARAQVVA